MTEKYKPTENEIMKAESHLKADEKLMKSSEEREKRLILHEKIDTLIYKNIDTYNLKRESIQKLGKELEAKGLNPTDYKLWHRIIGSTPQKKGLPLDTPENDIEKFIESL